jgi:hypothetical protein
LAALTTLPNVVAGEAGSNVGGKALDPVGVAPVFLYAAGEYDDCASPPSTGASVGRLRELGEAIVGWYEASQLRWAEFEPLPH